MEALNRHGLRFNPEADVQLFEEAVFCRAYFTPIPALVALLKYGCPVRWVEAVQRAEQRKDSEQALSLITYQRRRAELRAARVAAEGGKGGS